MSRNTRGIMSSGLTLGISAVLLLTGCSSAAVSVDPTASTEIASPSAENTETPMPSTQALVIPTCEHMNYIAQGQYEEFGPESFAEPAGPVGLDAFNAAAGPLAQQAMSAAVRVEGCRWPIHSQGTVTQYVAELSTQQQGELTLALEQDAEVEKRTVDSAPTFTLQVPAPDPAMSSSKLTYIFQDDVWITLVDVGGNRDYIGGAIRGIRADNPDLVPQTAVPDNQASSCSGVSAQAALAEGAATVPGSWDLTGSYSDMSGYDECAELSWIVLRPEPCCTRFSITPVLFFHAGKLVPEATVDRFALDGAVERLASDSASVTFMWPGDDIAGTANVATSTYSWNEASDAVEREGELPPS